MTLEEINELQEWISEAIEPKPKPRDITFGSTRPILSFGDCWYWIQTPPHHMDQIWKGEWSPRHWVTDETATAMLLDIMPLPHLWKNGDDEWTCEPDDTDEAIVSDADRKIAVCKAFKAWKNSQ